MFLNYEPGDFVISPNNKSWGTGQIQSIINNKVTVNFENAGKKVININEFVLERVRNGEEDPHCDCGGIIKTATIMFGQSLVPEDLKRMLEALDSCDLLLTIGTSLQVFPVASVIEGAVLRDVKIVIVNGQPTSSDIYAEVAVQGSISEVLPLILNSEDS